MPRAQHSVVLHVDSTLQVRNLGVSRTFRDGWQLCLHATYELHFVRTKFAILMLITKIEFIKYLFIYSVSLLLVIHIPSLQSPNAQWLVTSSIVPLHTSDGRVAERSKALV